MGRMLEVLKQAEASRKGPAEPAPAPRPYQPAPEDHPEDSPGEQLEDEADEIPFIEVGGRKTPLEGSPSVLAAPARSAAPAPVCAPAPACAPAIPERIPVAVFLRPYPAEPDPLPPASERFVPDLVAFHQPDHPVSQQYLALLKSLAAPAPTGRGQVLLLSPVEPGCGTTTALLNLAITGARSGKLRVAVLDADMRQPGVAHRLGLPPAPGLLEVLTGKVSLQRALRETGQPNLHALTAGDTAAAGGFRLAGDAMRSVLRHLRGRFDLVLVDAMPWDGRPDVVTLGSYCDAVYLVVRDEQAQQPRVEELLQLIPQQGSRLRGCIVTHRP